MNIYRNVLFDYLNERNEKTTEGEKESRWERGRVPKKAECLINETPMQSGWTNDVILILCKNWLIR